MNSIQVENYRKKSEGPSKMDIACTTRAKMCEELGLNQQAAMTKASAKPSDYYPEVGLDDYNVWRLFLPTSYLKSAGHWQVYAFDDIPTGALDEIRFAQSLGLFHDFEIRTTERTLNRDPVVFGILNNPATNSFRAHLITRWGESLMSLKDIFERLIQARVANYKDLPAKMQEWLRDQFREYVATGRAGHEHPWTRWTAEVAGMTWFRKHCGSKLLLVDVGCDCKAPYRFCATCGHNQKL